MDAGKNKFKRMPLDAYNMMMLQKAQRNGRVLYSLNSFPNSLGQIENLPGSDNKKACIFPYFDYKIISEKELLLKDWKYFNTGVFHEIHRKLGFGKGFALWEN